LSETELFEAFNSRGGGDFLLSHDLEDIVTVIDGRSALADEVQRSPEELRAYIAEQMRSLEQAPGFLDALAGHLPGDSRHPALLLLH
jgi:hypothetical protein